MINSLGYPSLWPHSCTVAAKKYKLQTLYSVESLTECSAGQKIVTTLNLACLHALSRCFLRR